MRGAYDLIIDVLINEAPVIKEYEAEQDKGVYSIQLRGFSGAYFVTAPEYSDSEMFLTQEAADHYIQLDFGEFIKE